MNPGFCPFAESPTVNNAFLASPSGIASPFIMRFFTDKVIFAPLPDDFAQRRLFFWHFPPIRFHVFIGTVSNPNTVL